MRKRKLPELKKNEKPPQEKDLSELNVGWPKSLVAEAGKKGLL